MFRTINMAKSIIRLSLKNENQNSIEIYLVIIIRVNYQVSPYHLRHISIWSITF